MDSLSMTASIITILQLTAVFTGYLIDMRHAREEQKLLAVEASSLYGLLTSLRFRVEGARSSDPWFNQVKLLGQEYGPLDQFKDSLEKLLEHLSLKRRRGTVNSALMWTFTKSQVEDTLKRMERLKSLVQCALTEDLFTLSTAIREDVASLSTQMNQLHAHTEQLLFRDNEDMLRRLAQWLDIPDPSINYRAALRKLHPDSGRWLIDGTSFEAWKRSDFSLMWLHGNVGCGKTVLSAAILQEVIQLQASLPDIIVGYFYFDFNDVKKQASHKAMRTLLFQLTRHSRSGCQHLEQMYQKCGNGQERPSDEAIQSSLLETISDGGTKYIVLDALDECADREGFLQFLCSIVAAKPIGLHLIATSRRERDIEEQLGSIATHNINIQSTVVDEDIRIYIKDRLANDHKLKRWPMAVHEEILGKMMYKANGMFQWVYCQLELIRQCIKLKAIRKVLSQLPATLGETYERILLDLKLRGQLQDAIIVLQWLCFSHRPLHLSEVVEVLAIEYGDNGGFFPEERLPEPDDVLVVCSSLICYHASDNDSYDEYGDDASYNLSSAQAYRTQIRLAHFSVKEYLLSEWTILRANFQTPTCHGQIAEGCLHYLLHIVNQAPLTVEVLTQHPLARYAAEYWWQHAHDVDVIDGQKVFDLSSRLLTDDSLTLLSWIQLYNPDHPREKPNMSLPSTDVAQPLYYAALVGLPKVVKTVLARTENVNAQGGMYGNALQAASKGGYENVVQMLLDAGAEADAQGGWYDNAIRAASTNGHEKVVQILLDAGAKVNTQRDKYTLQCASANGHEKIVQLLLNAGMEIDNQEDCCCGAVKELSWDNASDYLWNFGIPVHTQGPCGNPFEAASANGHEGVVEILLKARACVNSRGGYYGNALQAASAGGYEKIVQMLVDAGAQVNARGGHFSNALQAASEGGHEMVVQILLKAGAEVNVRRGYFRNALQAALVRGHERVVQMLLDAGAEANARGEHLTNVLQATLGKDHDKVV